jgi:probable F420-dependent oxidoreductase
VRFGIVWNTAWYGIDPDQLVAVARHAEECGFESFTVPEHVALHVGATLGGMAIPSDLPLADPLELLTFVAASTERLLLGTAVLLLPHRHPVVLAKRLATLDVLSRGRLRLLTVGIGSLPGESAAVGIDHRTRGRRADEALDVLRLLWAGGADGVSYAGEFFALDGVTSFPKPYDGSGIPVHVGGSSEAAARRAGLRGDGWFPGGRLALVDRAAQLELVRETARAAGRDPDTLEYTRLGAIDMDEGDVAARAEQGVHRLMVAPSATDLDSQLRELDAFATRHGLG